MQNVSVLFLVFVLCQPSHLSAQAALPASQTANSGALPKQAVNLPVGTWKYTDVLPGMPQPNANSTSSISIKDDGGTWTVTTAFEFPEGPVTDVSTIEKGTLILLRESFKHFLHRDQPWKPVAISLDFAGNKVTGAMKYVSDPDKPVTMDLGGPIFTYPAGWIGCLPLAEGYSTTFRYFDVERLPIKPQATIKQVQLKVLGMERVTVPAGTFDSYKVELTAADGRSSRETLWVDKDSRMLVKASGVDELYGAFTTERVP
jgi:hypothetical protein